jgi:hypothetical protein
MLEVERGATEATKENLLSRKLENLWRRVMKEAKTHVGLQLR